MRVPARVIALLCSLIIGLLMVEIFTDTAPVQPISQTASEWKQDLANKLDKAFNKVGQFNDKTSDAANKVRNR